MRSGQFYRGKIDGIISLGGGGGTAIGTAAMRALPLGFPKVMVSTLASGQTAPYVGTSDLVLMPAVVDVACFSGSPPTIGIVVSRTVGPRPSVVVAKAPFPSSAVPHSVEAPSAVWIASATRWA